MQLSDGISLDLVKCVFVCVYCILKRRCTVDWPKSSKQVLTQELDIPEHCLCEYTEVLRRPHWKNNKTAVWLVALVCAGNIIYLTAFSHFTMVYIWIGYYSVHSTQSINQSWFSLWWTSRWYMFKKKCSGQVHSLCYIFRYIMLFHCWKGHAERCHMEILPI